jgi:malate permease and related proteins
MTNFIVIFFALALGLFCRKTQKFPANAGYCFNLFVIYVPLPALIMAKFPALLQSVELTGHWWVPVSMAWISFMLSWIIVTFLSKRYSWSAPKTGALILAAGLGNTSFVGFPLLEALVGSEAISVGILADQPGSFLVLSTLGVFVAARYGGGSSHWRWMIQRVLFFPPFIAMVFSLLWTASGLWGVEFLSPAFEKISLTLVPVALFAVGFQTQLQWPVIRRRLFPLTVGLSLKLLFMPLFFLFFYKYFLGVNDLFSRVTILESAMAVQITAAVVATEFNLDAELVNLLVGISIPLSLLTVPVWNFLVFS